MEATQLRSCCRAQRQCHGQRAPCAAATLRRRPTRGLCLVVAARQQQVAVDPAPPASPPSGQWSSALPIVLAAAASFGAGLVFKRRTVPPAPQQRRQLEPWPEIPRPDADPRAYQLALARTRQALDVQRAVAYMRGGDPARSMVELHRALGENAVCRTPLLDGHQTRATLADLYRMHLQNTPVPHNFAELLQLRELLGISNQEAEELEVEVLQEGAAFSI